MRTNGRHEDLRQKCNDKLASESGHSEWTRLACHLQHHQCADPRTRLLPRYKHSTRLERESRRIAGDFLFHKTTMGGHRIGITWGTSLLPYYSTLSLAITSVSRRPLSSRPSSVFWENNASPRRNGGPPPVDTLRSPWLCPLLLTRYRCWAFFLDQHLSHCRQHSG